MPAATPVAAKMTLDEFLAWEERQEEKWELIDGVPFKRWDLRGMAGGTRRHMRAAINIITALKPKLRGGPCAPFSSDFKVTLQTGQARYPDAGVECGGLDPTELTAKNPRAIFEVLSPSNTLPLQLQLLDDYQSIESVDTIVFVSQTEPLVLVWRRAGGAWAREEVAGLDGVIPLPSLGIALTLSEIYDDVTFVDPPTA